MTVHSIDCDRLSEYEDQPERWLDLRWHDGSHPAVYTCALDITIGNGAGVLGRVCTLIGEASANISDLEFVERKPDFYPEKLENRNLELRVFSRIREIC